MYKLYFNKMYTHIKIFPSLSLSFFLSLALTVFLTAPLLFPGHGYVWEGLTAEASGTAGPSFIISGFCSHFPVHSLRFHFGDKQKVQHKQKLYMSSVPDLHQGKNFGQSFSCLEHCLTQSWHLIHIC